jgi:hypothetical protein
MAETVRECYEAFVIYNFVLYLAQYLGGSATISQILSQKDPVSIPRAPTPGPPPPGAQRAWFPTKRTANNTNPPPAPSQVSHLWPLNLCLPQWPMGRRYLRVCRRGALQYVVVRLTISAIGCAWVLTEYALTSRLGFPMPRYQEGEYKSAYPYLAIINACSQGWAIYCLVMFFRAVRVELSPIRPLLKFGLIKAVVFLTFWQSLGIELLMPWLWAHESGARSGSDRQAAATLKAALICFEMLIASLVFPFAFPASDYAPPGARLPIDETPPAAEPIRAKTGSKPTLSGTLFEALVPKDVVLDMKASSWGLFTPRSLGLAQFVRRVAPAKQGERTPRSPALSETTTMSQRGSLPPSPDVPRRNRQGSAAAGGSSELEQPEEWWRRWPWPPGTGGGASEAAAQMPATLSVGPPHTDELEERAYNQLSG